MRDIKSNSDMLFSVGGIVDTFGGRSRIRAIINQIVPLTVSIFVEMKRPVSPYTSVSNLLGGRSVFIENLNVIKNGFLVTFDYLIRESNDEIVDMLIDMWFEYEQPFVSFFQSVSKEARSINSKMTWRDVTELESCFVLFKKAEQEVVWVGKSKDIITDLEAILEDC